MEDANGKRDKATINIRQMEIDDISAVYHLGEELFTSDEFPFLYRTWDSYEVTGYFTSDSDYCLVAALKRPTHRRNRSHSSRLCRQPNSTWTLSCLCRR